MPEKVGVKVYLPVPLHGALRLAAMRETVATGRRVSQTEIVEAGIRAEIDKRAQMRKLARTR